VTAIAACMNAMFAPAVTMRRRPSATSKPFSARNLLRKTFDERRQVFAVLTIVRRRAFRGRARRIDRRPRRTVVRRALAERDGAGHLPDQVADDRHDGRLHGASMRLRDVTVWRMRRFTALQPQRTPR
jgi:hypothetical protein